MAEKRKLLNEIDKCYKKIEEGFEIFDDIMAKMVEANSDNQREKFQDDLKKEIKKLQRLRDQIKGWQNSSEIKDKDSLSKFRKLIEHRMEIFKDVERENKTKPHSKQGLSAEDKLDPKEKEKCDTIEWLNCQIRRIQDEIDRTESKIESLSQTAETGKKRGKKDDSKRNDKEKAEEFRKHLDRVKFHLMNLEVCMRMITNEKLEIKDVVGKLKEPLEMYIDALDPENDEDPETLDPEDIYEELNFGTYLSQLGGMSMNSVDDEKIGPNNDNASHKSSSPPPDLWAPQKHQNGEPDSHDKTAVTAPMTPVTPTAVTAAAGVSTRTASESASSHKSAVSGGTVSITSLKLTRLGSQVSNASSSVVSSPLPQTPPAVPGIPYNSVAAGKMHTPPMAKLHAACTQKIQQPLTADNTNDDSITTAVGAETDGEKYGGTLEIREGMELTAALPSSASTSSDHNGGGGGTGSLGSNNIGREQQQSISLEEEECDEDGADNEELLLADDASPGDQRVQLLQQQEEDVQEILTAAAAVASEMYGNGNNKLFQPNEDNNANGGAGAGGYSTTKNSSTIIQPWLGASPLGMVPVNDELNYQQQMLEATLLRCPVQMDSDKPRSYLPKMPCQTPPYYPQAPLPNADSLEYYLRLSVETLFFTFYYMEGSRAQLLAAKALKKLSWRFHTKYLMWFQRHEEPKQITDDYEQGTYVYFDFEKWVQRKKEQFTFEYKYLEDKDFE